MWFALEPDEKLPFVRDYIRDSYFSLCHAVCLLAEEELIPDKEAERVFQKMFAIDDIIFDGQRGTDCPWYIAESRLEFAKVLARLGRFPEMYEALHTAVDAIIAFECRSESWSYSSLLLGEQNKTSDFDTADSRPPREIMRDSRLNAKEFDTVRNSEAFQAILQKLN